ncbi:GAF domain-containing protein [Candidatus Villigracilis saccharophilus]|uniref:GAF domain-containing protein n=1 Tax=Candidatus Villigracilis saccharophilus TaxID=3140684 RepID=UPI0031376C10|nr:GAF domain-containing protein [Anaerolineales bacterium]
MIEDRSRSLLELLMNVSREVATALDLRTVLQRLLYAALQHVGGERGSIVVMDDLGKPVDATIVFGTQFHDHTTQQLRDTVERSLAGWVVQNRKSTLVTDTSKDHRWLRRTDDSADKSGAKSAICVPLLARDRLVGVLTLVHSIPNSFNEEHLALMRLSLIRRVWLFECAFIHGKPAHRTRYVRAGRSGCGDQYLIGNNGCMAPYS